MNITRKIPAWFRWKNTISFLRCNFAFVVAFIVMAGITAFYVSLWAEHYSEPNDFAHEEVIIDFQAGQNFAEKGFINLGFLTDHSLDDAPDAPPVHYTHQPSLPIVFIGALIKIGINTLPGVRLVMIFIFLAGLVAMMAFFWKNFTPWHGIAAAVLIALNGRMVLPLADHTTHSWWLLLSFLTLWAVSHPKEKSFYLWIAALGIFLVSWTNYIQLIVLMVTLGGLWLVRVPNFTLRRVIFLFLVAGSGIALHLIQNFVVLGPEVAWQDITTSLGNRIFGDPTREALRAFSQENNLILWGVASATEGANPFAFLWREYSYFGIPLLLSILGLFVLGFLSRFSSSRLSLRLIAVFLVASISFHVFLPAAGQAYYFPFVIAIPVATVIGLFIGDAIASLSQYSRRDYIPVPLMDFLRRHSANIALLAVAGVAFWQTAALGLSNYEPADNPPAVAELQILKDFEGEGFWTNITPHQVSYYTHSWVVGQMPLDGLKNTDINQAYVIPVSMMSSTWQKVNHPHYFFFAENNVLWFLPDTGERLKEYRRYLENNFPVVAWSPQRTSFIVDLSAGPLGTSRIVPGDQEFNIEPFYRIAVQPDRISASSALNQNMTAANLLQSDTAGFWHVDTSKTGPEWVTVDLQSELAAAILRIKPREDHTLQLWDGNKAVFRASDDGTTWESLAVLELDRTSVRDDWINFQILSPKPHRYYQLSIQDDTFFALGKMELYALPQSGVIPDFIPDIPPDELPEVTISAMTQLDLTDYNLVHLEDSQLEVSSVHAPSMNAAALLQPGTLGFWHVKAPREENPAWIIIDLNEPINIDVLRLRPRAGLPEQLWRGGSAILSGSNNSRDWEPITLLNIDSGSLVDDWIYFRLPEIQESYRYLRLSIYDPNFFSIARLELYQHS